MAGSAVLLQSLGNGVIWDQNGNALTHQVYVYQHGTTTQVPVYSSAAMTSQLTQPLTTGTNGAEPGGIPGWVAAEQVVDFFDQTANLTTPANPVGAQDLVSVDPATGALAVGGGTVPLLTSVLSGAGLGGASVQRQSAYRVSQGVPFGQHVSHSTDVLSDGVNTGINCRIAQTAPSAGGGIRIGYGAWYQMEIALPNDVTVTASIEYPAGTYYPLYWQGQSGSSRSVLVKAGEPIVFSDAAGIDHIPAGAQYWIKLFVQVAPVLSTSPTSALSTGSPITTLPATNTSSTTIPSGATIAIASGTHSQTFTTSGPIAPGATVAVNSQTPNYAYPTTSVITYNTAVWANTITPSSANGEGFTIGTIQTDMTTSALTGAVQSYTAPNATVYTQMPSVNVVLAQSAPASQRGVAMFGDSRMDGFRGGPVSTDSNWLTMAMGTAYGVTWLSRQGGVAYQAIGSTAQHRWALAALCDVLVNGFGINDISGGQTLAQVQASTVAIGVAAQLRGTPAISTTLPPESTSTDYWATTANQTAMTNETVRRDFNWWLRSGMPIDPTAVAVISGTGTMASGSNQLTSVTGSFSNGQTVTAWGIPAGTTVLSGGGTATLTLSATCTQNRTGAPLSAGALLAGSSGHPYVGFFELANQVEPTQDAGIWDVVGYTGTANLTSGSTAVTNASTGFQNGQAFNSASTPVGTYVVSGGGTANLVLSLPAGATVTNASVVAGYTCDGIHAAPAGDALLAAGVKLSLLTAAPPSPSVVTVVGPTGPQGPGSGTPGIQGARGSNWFPYVGSGTPAGITGMVNGDFCLRSDGEVFEYLAGAWTDTTINIKGASGSGSSATLGVPAPKDSGFLTWTMDPAAVSTSSALGAGYQYFHRVRIDQATAVSNLILNVVTAGATLTQGQSQGCLYDVNGNLLATTPDMSGTTFSVSTTAASATVTGSNFASTMVGAQYSIATVPTFTVSTTQGSPVVTGTGLSGLSAGQQFTIAGVLGTFTVLSVQSATQITVTANLPVTVASATMTQVFQVQSVQSSTSLTMTNPVPATVSAQTMAPAANYSWLITGIKTMPFQSQYSAAAGTYFISWLSNGTTRPAMSRQSGTGIVSLEQGPPYRSMLNVASGVTTPPASLPYTAANVTSYVALFFAALS